MPEYKYKCRNCEKTVVVYQPITAEPVLDCGSCNGKMHRVIQAVGVAFKGSGFYSTDNSINERF